MYKKNHSFFHAGKALENAIIVSKETSTADEVTITIFLGLLQCFKYKNILGLNLVSNLLTHK